MAFVHGSDSFLSLDGTTVSSYVDSVTHDRNVALANVTAFGNNDDAFIAGLESGAFSVNGHWDATQQGVLNGVFDGASFTAIYGPAGSTAGLVKYTATVFIESYQESSPVGDKVSWSAQLRRSGDLTVGTF